MPRNASQANGRARMEIGRKRARDRVSIGGKEPARSAERSDHECDLSGVADARLVGRRRGVIVLGALELLELAVQIALADAEDARGLLAMALARLHHAEQVAAFDFFQRHQAPVLFSRAER